MNMREVGRERGRKAAAAALRDDEDLVEKMNRHFRMTLELYPTVGPIDIAAEIRAFDRERLDSTPDYTRFPEMRGLIDRHIGEREGFREATGLDETASAFYYSFDFYALRRLNCRHVARYDLVTPQHQCTNVFFPHGKDGVTISNNRDDVPRPWYHEKVVNYRIKPLKDAQYSWIQGSVSSTTLMDEEPKCLFPCYPYELVPEETLQDIREIVKFMTRYVEFWGPANQIFVDRNHNAVAVEKSNCRVAYHWPTSNGAVCVTACSYLDPQMNAFKRERTLVAAKMKGESREDSLDMNFSDACDRRHQRLWDLTNKEAQRPGGTTLWGAFEVVADTAVPFPERICLAGEKLDPKREANANWTLLQHAEVITGPNRRGLYRTVQDMEHPRPITTETPKLVLGEGVTMRPEWQKDVDAGRCTLAQAFIEPEIECGVTPA